MSNQPQEKNILIAPIETKETAEKVIHIVVSVLYVYALIDVVLGMLMLGMPAVIDGIFFAVFAYLLKRFQSVGVAGVLLFLSCISGLLGFIMNAVNGDGNVDTLGMMTSLGIVFLSANAVRATSWIAKEKKKAEPSS